MRRVLVALAFAGALGAPGKEAHAQTWAAWHGCWRVAGDAGGGLVCVLPGADAVSARLLTMNGNTVANEIVVHADNVERPISEGGCNGSGKAFFSQDRRRIFTRAELDCAGTKRVSSGVIALVTEREWLEAQAITVGDQHAARSVRYRAAGRAEMPAFIVNQLPAGQELVQEAARIEATTPLDIASVTEASRHLAAPAVEALIAARNHGFDLTARRLVQMKEQGVAPSTIDVMVALTFPEQFAVRENGNDFDYEGIEEGDVRVSSFSFNDCYDGYGSARSSRYGRYNSCYENYGFSSYRYSRFGYSPWGYDNYGWRYNNPIVVVVDPRSEETTTPGAVTRGGYTRGSSSGSSVRSGTSSTGSPRVSSGTSGSGSAGSTSSAGSGSSSTGSSTTARTAKPRGGGS